MPIRSAARLAPLVLCAALAATTGDALAQGGNAGKNRSVQRGETHGHDRSAEQQALSAAVRRVESRTGGQVLSAERIPFDGHAVSRIKVVDASGRVRIYVDDSNATRGRGRGNLPEPPRTRDDDN